MEIHKSSDLPWDDLPTGIAHLLGTYGPGFENVPILPMRTVSFAIGAYDALERGSRPEAQVLLERVATEVPRNSLLARFLWFLARELETNDANGVDLTGALGAATLVLFGSSIDEVPPNLARRLVEMSVRSIDALGPNVVTSLVLGRLLDYEVPPDVDLVLARALRTASDALDPLLDQVVLLLEINALKRMEPRPVSEICECYALFAERHAEDFPHRLGAGDVPSLLRLVADDTWELEQQATPARFTEDEGNFLRWDDREEHARTRAVMFQLASQWQRFQEETQAQLAAVMDATSQTAGGHREILRTLDLLIEREDEAVLNLEHSLADRFGPGWETLAAETRRSIAAGELLMRRRRRASASPPALAAFAFARAFEREVEDRIWFPLRGELQTAPVRLERGLGNLVRALEAVRSSAPKRAILRRLWPEHERLLLDELPPAVRRLARLRNPGIHGEEVTWAEVERIRAIVAPPRRTDSLLVRLPVRRGDSA